MRALLAAILVAVPAFAAPPAARAQANAYRFEITSVSDSVFAFMTLGDRWVHAGLHGIAVDPARHDALVARFRVLHVDHGQATALITGQTTHLTMDHVALVTRPATPWFKQRNFWVGTVLGGVLGAVIATR